jgi:hypothetical protein
MSVESFLLLAQTSTESADLQVYSYGDKSRGAGYFRKAGGLHTLLFVLDNFKGSIKIQGTLEMYPGDNDWIDLDYTNGSALDSLDSTVLTTNETRNILGNWLWIRAAYIIEQGTISEIRYNF